MDEIFNHPDSPFLKSALSLFIGPLSHQDFVGYLSAKVRTGNRTIATNVLSRTFELTDSVTGDIQQFCEALWTISNDRDVIGNEMIPAAIHLVFAREQKSYEGCWPVWSIVMSGFYRPWRS